MKEILLVGPTKKSEQCFNFGGGECVRQIVVFNHTNDYEGAFFFQTREPFMASYIFSND